MFIVFMFLVLIFNVLH